MNPFERDVRQLTGMEESESGPTQDAGEEQAKRRKLHVETNLKDSAVENCADWTGTSPTKEWKPTLARQNCISANKDSSPMKGWLNLSPLKRKKLPTSMAWLESPRKNGFRSLKSMDEGESRCKKPKLTNQKCLSLTTKIRRDDGSNPSLISKISRQDMTIDSKMKQKIAPQTTSSRSAASSLASLASTANYQAGAYEEV